ncbi:MAG: hypothetical protein ACE37J_02135 [Pikeienuella sp.]|uniref:hypothetical protein n=1 Tax=Pikeienuella sp. TaxID=2831957 RepID=UPI00391C2802
MSAHSSFLVYERFRWFKRSAWLCLLVIVIYSAYAPVGGRNGGTWVGYGLGGLGLALILWLTWLGVKKRGFSTGAKGVKGWTSAHVYLGISLVVIATLHTGFEFGWNVHTLAYALMMLVILSGAFGVFAYVRYPRLMSQNMSGQSAEGLRRESAEIDIRLQRLAQRLPDAFAAAAREALEARIGGGFFQLLSGSSRRCAAASALGKARAEAERITDPEQQNAATEMIAALSRKAEISARLRRDLSFKAMMDVWLWIHVPVTIGLIATLIAHVLIVFFYW